MRLGLLLEAENPIRSDVRVLRVFGQRGCRDTGQAPQMCESKDHWQGYVSPLDTACSI